MSDTPTPIPRNIIKAMSPAARKLWKKHCAHARGINEKLLIHFAAYLNARSEYEEAIKRIEKIESDGGDSFVAVHKNGTMGLHPLRTLLDKSRRAMSDELKRCGLTLDKVEDDDVDEPFDPLKQ